jgi:lipopolysaccharide export system permease protein
VVLLTQSLRFLELVIESGASAGAFWILTMLALPRFLEVIVPLSIMVSCVFVFSRMSSQSELVVMRTSGMSPMQILKPALLMAGIVTVFLWFITLWAAPKSLATLQQMRQLIRAQISTVFLRENVFNRLGEGFTVYVRGYNGEGEMAGVLIHDSRNGNDEASTILAKRGEILEQGDGYEVVVYDGSRQTYEPETGILQRLDFERYRVELPSGGAIRKRWREPDERTIFELLKPNSSVKRDLDNLREFQVEIHRRLTAPLLTIAFALIAGLAMVTGPVNRRGNGFKTGAAVMVCIVLQGLFIAAYNIARKEPAGTALMYFVVLLPMSGGFFMLSQWGENWRRKILYTRRTAVRKSKVV